MKRITGGFLLCACLGVAAACDTTPTTPDTGGATTSSITQVFSSTLVPGETPSFNFTLPATAPLNLTFGSLTDAAGQPLGTSVTLKYGVLPATGEGCTSLKKLTVTAGLKSQISVMASAGQYCVGLEDTAGVPVTANFAIRILYGTFDNLSGENPITYPSSVVPTGFTARSFNASTAGDVAIIMDNISPDSVTALGVGLGIPKNDSTGCEIATTLIAARGTQLMAPVDAGRYCVKIFDPGTLTNTAGFLIRIVHP
jgi:hypothetical protein